MKKIPLRVYFMALMALLTAVAATVLIIRLASNHRFVKAYDNGEYLIDNEKMLLNLNVPESYLPYYNLGNVAFQNEDYNSSIGYYTRALSLFPIGQKECDIRVNLALSMCYSINFDKLDSKESVDNALVILYKARDILLVNDWATESGEDYRDEDAEKLKEDIDKMIEKLKETQNSSDNNNQNQDDDNQNKDDKDNQQDDSGSQSDREKRQREKIEQNKKNALDERRQSQSDLDKDVNGDGEDSDNGIGGVGGKGYKPW